MGRSKVKANREWIARSNDPLVVGLLLAASPAACSGASNHAGPTVQLSGEVKSTNGVASPLPAGTALAMLHFGPTRTSAIDLRAPDLETWGSESRAGYEFCPTGCLGITSNGGLALRLPPSATQMAIRYRTGHGGLGSPVAPATPLIVTAATTGTPTATALPQAASGFEDAVVTLPKGSSDLFVTLTVPIGTFDRSDCKAPADWFVYVESISVNP